MDDVNINNIYLGIEEVELDGEEWVKLTWNHENSHDSESFQLPKIQRDSGNEIIQTEDYDSKELLSTDSEDISDGISVITESDTDVNANFFRICEFHHEPRKSLQRPELDALSMNPTNIFITCVLGIIVGLIFIYDPSFTIPKINSVSSGVDTESLKTASHNIVNTCKELTDVKIMLNEIKAHIATNKKITKQFLAQFFEITDSSNSTYSKPIIDTKESFNSTQHPLEQLQMSLHVLSSLAFIYNNNSTLKNKMNKTLDIVSDTKTFYDTLTLFTNSTENVLDPIVLNFLQPNSDNMHITSKSLLSNLVEKVNKVTSKVYNKYAKERYKLHKKLCHLKSILPDDKILKRLTENNQLFKNYDKSCFLNYTSKNLDNKLNTKGNTKTKSVKEQKNEKEININNKMEHTMHEKKNTHKMYDNKREEPLKNKKNTRQDTDKSTTMKFLRNTGHKIHNASQLLLSEVVENISQLRHQLSKKLYYLKNILPDNSELLKQLIEDDKEDNKRLDKRYKEKNDYLKSKVISKDDIPNNGFDNILIPQKNTCPLSTNYCPKFNINDSTFDTVPNHKTKNEKHKEYIKNKEIIINHENSTKILPVEEKSGPSKKDYFKSDGSTKKIINNKSNYKEKYTSSQNKVKNHISEHSDKSEHSLFDSCTVKQDNQKYTNIDRKSDSKSFHEYKKRWQRDDSDWYFQRVRSRRNARRHADFMYRQNTKWFWKNRW
ncbi:uncharacterized protein MAL13P1.304 [Monomorium pharaonis]|uniref:uncharacterized protein MAL13P1.304 n=1 Tax=Monomorium pharaonis TaxID=307658 RepID=UPI00063F2E62|nr:uncharacterized protein MAL13P1.304 [Monomorium pharaonis]